MFRSERIERRGELPTYTITAVSQSVRDWNSEKGGPMKGYRIHLDETPAGQGTDPELLRNVEWSRKVDSKPPEVGQRIEGTISKTDYGPRFKQAQSGGGGGGRGWQPKDPAERRAIAMQASQKVAASVLETAAAHGDYTPPSAGDVLGHVKSVAAGLYLQVQQAEADTIK